VWDVYYAGLLFPLLPGSPLEMDGHAPSTVAPPSAWRTQASQIAFCTRYPATDGEPTEGHLIINPTASSSTITGHATPQALTRDAYCINCRRALQHGHGRTGICDHHHLTCGRDLIVRPPPRRIEEHGAAVGTTSAAGAMTSGSPTLSRAWHAR